MLGLRSIFCKENHPKISPGGLLASEFPSVNTMETWKKEILKTRDDLELTDHAKSTFCAQEFCLESSSKASKSSSFGCLVGLEFAGSEALDCLRA